MLRDGAAVTGAGLALGVLGALGGTGALARFLHGVTRADAATYAAIALFVAVVGAAASFVPAWRATRVDPAITLRE